MVVTRSAAALEAADDKKVTPSSRPRRILVVGEVGDGKSTLINALRDPEKSDKAEAGKKKATKAVVTKKTEIEEEYPNKFVMEGDPEEDARIIELLKAMDEENCEYSERQRIGSGPPERLASSR